MIQIDLTEELIKISEENEDNQLDIVFEKNEKGVLVYKNRKFPIDIQKDCSILENWTFNTAKKAESKDWNNDFLSSLMKLWLNYIESYKVISDNNYFGMERIYSKMYQTYSVAKKQQ